MRGGKVNIDVLVRQVQPLCIPCLRSIIVDTLQAVAVDFFTETGVWQEMYEDVLPHGLNEVELYPPKDTEIVDVLAVKYRDSDQAINEELWSRDYHTVRLATNHAANDLCLEIAVVLRPSRFADEIPARFMEQWGDTLAQGALSKIKSMSGVKVEWTDMEGAAVALDLYNRGIARARAMQINI